MIDLLKAGPLGSHMKKYLDLRRSMGTRLLNIEYSLDHFDRFLAERYPKAKHVTRQIIMDYLASMGDLSNLNRFDRLSRIKQFCLYLFGIDGKSYVPEKGLVKQGPLKTKPHIYSDEEFGLILKSFKEKTPHDRGGRLLPHTLATVVSLLWVTGMRISEACSLNVEDVNFENKVIHLRQAKFRKERYVPISDSAATALLGYLKTKARFGCDNALKAPFFINRQGRQLTKGNVDTAFQEVKRKLGLKTAEGTSPRIHDIRHTFATRWLADLYLEGKDPMSMLPVLATYLGHTKVRHTQVYLHPALNLLEKAGKMFSDHVKKGA